MESGEWRRERGGRRGREEVRRKGEGKGEEDEGMSEVVT